MGAIRNFNLDYFIHGYGSEVFFETGTGYGTGIEHACRFGFKEIYSVEIIKEQVDKLSPIFAVDKRVKIINNTSIDALKEYVPKIDKKIMFFLDAHFPGADLGLKSFGEEQNESLRMPLLDELEYIKNNRDFKNDCIMIDDVMLYDDINQYQASHQKLTMDILPREHRNCIKDIVAIFDKTHQVTHLLQEQGYLIFTPKQ